MPVCSPPVRRDSASRSTPIVSDLGGTSGEALRPAPPPSQRSGSISFQTTQFQTVHEGAERDRRAANGSCTSSSRCFRSLRSALASVKGAATRSHSSPPGNVQAPSTVPASDRPSTCHRIALPCRMCRARRAARPPGPLAEPLHIAARSQGCWRLPANADHDQLRKADREHVGAGQGRDFIGGCPEVRHFGLVSPPIVAVANEPDRKLTPAQRRHQPADAG
jgi:hypothetical protein